ncbi:divalent metal cation transporter [Micromonosporaceae bacterium B7E4]
MVARRPVFHVIRERLGVRTAMLNLVAFVLLSLLTLAAETGGPALVLELVTGLNYLVWVPLISAAIWLVVWRWRLSVLENLFGLLGLTLLVFVMALFVLRRPAASAPRRQDRRTAAPDERPEADRNASDR